MLNKYILDVNVILDYYSYPRRELYQSSVKVFDYLKNKFIGLISSSSLDNIKFLKLKELMLDKKLSKTEAQEVVKELLRELTRYFKVAKTPSYVDIEENDIEDAQLIGSAIAIGAKIVTRDMGLLQRHPEICVHPDDFFNHLEEKEKIIPMLDLSQQTLYSLYEIERNIDNVIQKSNFILGSEVKDFEKRLSTYIGTKHAIGVASGTDALLVSLRALAIKLRAKEYWTNKDLIITTPFTFTATGDTILRSGATPLFVDIDLDTYNIDITKLKQAIKAYKTQVVGILPVHLYGLPCNMDEVMAVAKDDNLFVVEDCAQAFGSMYKGKKVGSFGDAGAFSFFPSKNLGAFGDAGAITTNDDEIAEIMKMLRVHGGRDKYNVEHIGYKARLDTLQASVLLAKLPHIDEFNNKRRQIADIYYRELKDCPYIKLPYIPSQDYHHTFHQFTVFLKGLSRDALQQTLKSQGIQTMVYYPVPLHKMKVFEGRCVMQETLANSEITSQGVLSLPIEPLQSKEASSRICRQITEFCKKP